MKHIKFFEAFKLPDRKPENLIQNCFSDINDEFGTHVEWKIYCDDVIDVRLKVDQILRISEMQEICEEYLIPGIGRMGDEGFDHKR